MSSLILSKSSLRASLLSSRIFLKSLSVTSVFTSVEISALTLFMSEAMPLFADAVAKKARVESVRTAMNFDFMFSS